MTSGIPTSLVLRLLRHEAAVHAVPDRIIRELGDAILLHDTVDPEPFWNRLEAVQFPSDPRDFDRRLAEIGILFASIGRQPHVWLLPPHDSPTDVYDRLVANGFEDAGPGHLMVATNDAAARSALSRVPAPGVTIERYRDIHGADAERAANAVVGVLLTAFDVGDERRPGVVSETLATLGDSRFTHYLVRLDGAPVAAARRATFDRMSYLSSIGTSTAARGRGLGRLVSATAMVDGFEEGSELVHLGVFHDNVPARSLYEALGFDYAGEPGPDMILVG